MVSRQSNCGLARRRAVPDKDWQTTGRRLTLCSIRSLRSHSRSSVTVAVSATPAAAASTTTAAPVASAPTRTLLKRACFVDRQAAAIELSPVELRDCLFSVLVAHLHKAETLRTSGVPVRYYVYRLDRSNLLKQVSQIRLCRLVRQVSDVHSFAHISPDAG